MEFELKGPLKKYRRMRSWRRSAAGVIAFGGIAAPAGLLEFNRIDFLDLGGQECLCFGASQNWKYV